MGIININAKGMFKKLLNKNEIKTMEKIEAIMILI
jgi:hypothetical protein